MIFEKTKSVTINLNHGLGNQLSLYFAGLAYATEYQLNYDVYAANLESSSHDSVHEILNFNLPGNILPAGIKRSHIKPKFQQYLAHRFPYSFLITGRYFSTTLGFDNHLLRTPGVRNLNGFFHTFAYYEYCKENFVGLSAEELIPLSSYAKSVKSRIRENRSVAIHIRRGDYQSHVNTLGLLDLDYYTEAINSLRLDLKTCNFYVFSDDIEAAKLLMNHLGIHHAEFPEEGNSMRASEVLCLLGSADDLIMANSTLSYWAAILARDETRVIAPFPFYRKGKVENRFFYKVNWHLVNSHFK